MTSGSPANIAVKLPNDNRTPVVDTTCRPSCWVGRLVTSWPNNVRRRATATLLDNQHLLTCAHNLYKPALGGHALEVTFQPGAFRNAEGELSTPFGSIPVLRWELADGYRQQGAPQPSDNGIPLRDITKYLSDYAVCLLGETITTPPGRSLMNYGWPGATTVEGLACTILGYSGDLDPTGRTQYTRTGPVHVDSTEEYVSYQMSTYNGDSGAPVFYQQQGHTDWTIVAVHVSGVPPTPGAPGTGLNFGPALNEDVIDNLNAMIRAVDQK